MTSRQPCIHRLTYQALCVGIVLSIPQATNELIDLADRFSAPVTGVSCPTGERVGRTHQPPALLTVPETSGRADETARSSCTR